MSPRLRRPAIVLVSVCFVLLAGVIVLAQKSAPPQNTKPQAAGAATDTSQPPSVGTPAPAKPAGEAPTGFAALDAIIKNGIANNNTAGAVLLVAHNGSVVYRKAFGNRTAAPNPEPMTVDTIFDLASLTKVVATTTCVMRLEQLGQIKLNDPIAKYIPDFAQNGKEDVTIRMLLTHYSGLPADLDFKQPWNGTAEGYSRANAAKLVNPPGSTFLYSDVGFVVLGELVEKVGGMPLDQYAQTYVFGPLGMSSTRFNPPASWGPRTAATQRDEHTGQTLRGTVHDPTARQMNGVSGDAGVFSTADDVAKFAQCILNGGAPILSPLIVEKMTTPQQPANMANVRGLGWDIDSPFSSNRGELLPVGSFGHTGFTGTSLWIDPTTNTYIILLTNSTLVKDGNVIGLRTEIATAVAAALNLDPTEEQKTRLARITGYNETQMAARRILVRNGKVLLGIDALEERKFDPLKVPNVTTPRVGLVTNQAGLDSRGKRTIDVIWQAPGIKLEAIFTPEHGPQGTADTTEIGNSKDGITGVPIYSVYGESDAKRRPPMDVIRKLDVIVFDLQDAGARFYTYETTLGYFLEAAAKAKKPIVVLDRPNPITGAYVQGPISDAGQESFVNYFPLPVRHGMTMGELAKLFNDEKHIDADLTVIPMRGWLRGDWFDSTGATWVNPSPNLRTLEQATLYPAVALIESTNVSVGRGTDMPFQVIGSPYFIAKELAGYLNAREIPGVRFVPTTFTPTAGLFARRDCYGVNIIVTNRDQLDAPELGIELAAALHKLYPLGYDMNKMNTLLANKAVFAALQAGEDPNRIAADWRDKLDDFTDLRVKYLLY
ncbi:MAG TPA: exo-beta-N-acetylmuramidase NamZ domain-containing protein [Terriglobales bacterium]|nr:exo-beta-N-acetylmuramidase NamZ domain-containing protein [Terriglobales bacterium]